MVTVITVTLNACIDHTIYIEDLERSIANDTSVVNVSRSTIRCAGKGLNVISYLESLGCICDLHAVCVVAHDDVDKFTRASGVRNYRIHPIGIHGYTRINTTLIQTSPQHKELHLKAPGVVMTTEESNTIVSKVQSSILSLCTSSSTYVCICGSLPPGMLTDDVINMCNNLVKQQIHLVVDVSGPLLYQLHRLLVFIIKPNLHEARSLSCPSCINLLSSL